jgi:hypothetical protein
MASPSALMDRVAAVTGMNRSTIENIYDGLRKTGEIPKGVRGRYGVQVTSQMAARLLIAMCGSEHVKDASDALRRYSGLSATYVQLFDSPDRLPRPASDRLPFVVERMPIPIAKDSWTKASSGFPRLGKLPSGHSFVEAMEALIESYIDDDSPGAYVNISLQGPYPWAGVKISLHEDNAKLTSSALISYNDDGDENGPGELAEIDPTKARQRRRFVELGRDMQVTSTVSQNTLREIGALLRDDKSPDAP